MDDGRPLEGGEDLESTLASSADTGSVLDIAALDELWSVQPSRVLGIQLSFLAGPSASSCKISSSSSFRVFARLATVRSDDGQRY